MARKGRNLFITLCVIVGLFVIAVAAVRIFLTREKLLAIVIPRIEKAVDAQVSIADIGINFPFGLGVDLDGLSFEKTLPDTSSLVFTSEKVTVRSSLMSLVRRKPEIKAADVRGGAVTLTNPKTRRETRLLGLDAHFSMKPAGEGSSLSAKALVDTILVSAVGGPPAMTLEKIGLAGELESDREFTSLAIKDARVSWEDLLTAKIKGEVRSIGTAPRVALTVESEDIALAPVLERAKSFRLEALARTSAKPAGAAEPKVPIATSGGTFDFNARVEGLVKEPLAMNLSFECGLKDLAVKAGDVASVAKLGAAFKGQGVVLAWQSLFPGPEKPTTPAQLAVAWQAVGLEGTVTIEGGDFVMSGGTPRGSTSGAAPAAGASAEPAAPAPAIRISSLKAKAEIAGPDIRKVSGEFIIGSSPYTFDASMINIMPAVAELSLVARNLQAAGQAQLPALGVLLDRMVNAPVVKLEMAGRSFDARPYQKPAAGASDATHPAAGASDATHPAAGASDATHPAAAQPAASPVASAQASTPAAGGGAGAVLFLKNTTFTAKLDSIIAREAVITAVEAKGAIRDGRVRVDPLTFACAGGTGGAVVSSDLRTNNRVETKIEASLEGVEAAQALARLGSAGNLVQGTFSFRSSASLVTGPGINPLTALTATGAALSKKGVVSFESFIEPLTKIEGFDVTPFRKFDFSEWSGTYIVKNGRFITDDWKINSSRGAWSIKGSFGFDGTLDYAVHVVIPPDVQKGMKDLDRYKSAFDLMRDKTGNLVLDIKVSGTAKRPSASLDLTQAKSKVQDKLIEGLKKKFLR